MKAIHTFLLGLAAIALCACPTGKPIAAVRPDSTLPLSATSPPSPPRVGMWLHPDIEIDEWMCSFETNPANPVIYVHSRIQPSTWRQVVAHSSVVVLNNFIFAQPLPWSVFLNTLTYAQYVAAFQAYPASSPEGLWFRRLNEHVRTPLAGLTQYGDPTAQKLIYIYAHMFGYDRAQAINLGLTPMGDLTYAWPPKGLDNSWPAAFLHDDDGAGILQPRPSFKNAETRNAMANAVYFFMKHFESVGAKVHLSPWREINGYADATRCQERGASCGLDSWNDLYDTYQAIAARVGGGGFDPARIALYPTVQLESFVGESERCVRPTVIDQVKQFYQRNAASGVPFAIGLSTYPSSEDDGLDKHRSQLRHLLDNLDSSTPVACDANGDGVTTLNEGINVARLTTDVRVPRTTPLTIGETSRPSWATFQTQDTPSVTANEKLGVSMANTHLRYDYRAIDGTPAYPLEFVSFALGPNWAFPATIHGKNLWITSAAGTARNWLTPMQPLAAQLALDTALDPDGDWDNDGVPGLVASKDSHAARRDLPRVLDNCPYQQNPSQADADSDGLGDDCDNCRNVANYPQEDWDQDGFGNACDPDVNNDGLIQVEVDLAVVKQCQGAAMDCLAHVTFPRLPAGQSAPDLNGKVVLIADMDADEDVDAADVVAWQALASSAALRASGFACAGTTPCPDPAIVMLRDGRTVTIPDPPPNHRTCESQEASHKKRAELSRETTE